MEPDMDNNKQQMDPQMNPQMDPQMNPKVDPQMDPAEYLNSISSGSGSDAQGTQGVSEVSFSAVPKQRKWLVILIIIVVSALIVGWLVIVGINKSDLDKLAGGSETTSEEEEWDEEAEATALSCSKELDEAELGDYAESPFSGKRYYFAAYRDGVLESIAQDTELLYSTEDAVKTAEVTEKNKYQEYLDARGWDEDPFESDFLWPEGSNVLNIYYNLEADELKLDNTERFMVPNNSDLSAKEVWDFYKEAGYTYTKMAD